MTEPQDRSDEDVVHLLLGVDGVGQKPVPEAESGVVDQQLDRPLGVLQPRLDRAELLPVGEVGGQHLHLHGVLLNELHGHLLQPLPVARHQDQVVAPRGELAGELMADSSSRTGDQGSSS